MRIVFQGGDNMLGRAVQLTLPYQSFGDSTLTDSQTAQEYLEQIIDLNQLDMIRRQNLKGGSYLWGDLPKDLGEDVRVLNLESSPTISINKFDLPKKSILYHVNLYNVPIVFSQFHRPLILSLANNHSLDMGRLAFVQETLAANLPGVVGVGKNYEDASKPLKIGRFTIYSFGAGCSGVPSSWKATQTEPGLSYLPAIDSDQNVKKAFELIKQVILKDSNMKTCTCISIHWGPNWSYPGDGQEFRVKLAHKLIDELNVDLIYGHSSHHIRGIEVYQGKLVLYGCGDLINDYEKISTRGNYNINGALFVVDLNDSTFNFENINLIPIEVVNLQCKQIKNPTKIKRLIEFINHQSEMDCPKTGIMLLN